MIRAYSDKKAMSPYETKQLYLRLAYPEKFWKIANHYYNANKAWGFGRYLEKLEKIKAEEENREQFLAYMKHFAIPKSVFRNKQYWHFLGNHV